MSMGDLTAGQRATLLDGFAGVPAPRRAAPVLVVPARRAAVVAPVLPNKDRACPGLPCGGLHRGTQDRGTVDPTEARPRAPTGTAAGPSARDHQGGGR